MITEINGDEDRSSTDWWVKYVNSAAGRAVVARFQWFQDTDVVGKIYQLPCCDQDCQIEFCDSWFSLLKIMTRCIRPYEAQTPCWGYNSQIAAATILLKHYLTNKVLDTATSWLPWNHFHENMVSNYI